MRHDKQNNTVHTLYMIYCVNRVLTGHVLGGIMWLELQSKLHFVTTLIKVATNKGAILVYLVHNKGCTNGSSQAGL